MVLEVSYLGYQAHGLTSLVDVNPFPLGTNSRTYTDFSYLDEFQNITHANYNGDVYKRQVLLWGLRNPSSPCLSAAGIPDFISGTEFARLVPSAQHA